MASGERSIATLGHLLETTRPPPDEVRSLLGSAEPARVHAAVLHIERRFRRDGQDPSELAELLGANVHGLPLESQLVVAALAVDGLPIAVSQVPSTLPPAVRLAWLRAELLQDPSGFLGHERSPIGREAIEGLPVERVIASGLLDRLVGGAEDNSHRMAVDYVRQGVERGLLEPALAQAWLLELAAGTNSAVSISALQLLREPWATSLTLPPLRFSGVKDAEVQVELVKLAAARCAADHLRRLDREGSPFPVVARELIVALGAVGAARDVDSILGRMAEDPFRNGGAGLDALVLLKRRGIPAEPAQADRLFELYLDHASLDPTRTAEVLASHADRIAAAVHLDPASGVDWSRMVGLLEAFGTRGAIARLRSILSRPDERAGWWYAARALGRLGAVDAEADILGRLDDEPDACLFALGLIGGDRTIEVLSGRVHRDDASPPTWLGEAARLLFLLAPSMVEVDALERRGYLTSALLRALPAHGDASRSSALRNVIRDATHPLRREAIQALGRTGGALVLDWLAELLTDPDADVRQEAVAALHVLGRRLHEMDSARPAHLSAAHPGDFVVAEAVVRRLREKRLETDMVVRLLDAMPPTGHPQLIPVVRPYLRSRDPEVQKRVLICLAAAGPAASAWVLPWISDEDITVSRQAVLALARIRARWLAEPIGAWLDQPNMNLKKTAAEALASAGDERSAVRLLEWLARHDNPGFRELLIRSLKTIAGRWYRCLVIARLRSAPSRRAAELLIDALDAELSAADVAALAARWSLEDWTQLLVERVHGGMISPTTDIAELDAELRRRGLAHRIPRLPAIADAGEDARKVQAVRGGARLQAGLRSLAGGGRDPEVAELLCGANQKGHLVVPPLSSQEVHALLDEYSILDQEARGGARQVLAAAELDPVAMVRAARLVRESPVDDIPAAMARTASSTWSLETARRELASSDRILRTVAARTLVLADAVDETSWPESEASLLIAHSIRARALDACFEWCIREGRLLELIRGLARALGPAATVEAVRTWMRSRPDLPASVVLELARLGPAGMAELERAACSAELELRVREQALSSLAMSGGAHPASLRDLLDDDHAALREGAARGLLRIGDPADRALVLQKFLDGAFRERFVVDLEHGDLPVLERGLGAPDRAIRLRLVRLVERLQDPRRVPLLLEIWRDADEEIEACARDALRSGDPAEVLPFIVPVVRAGDEAVLDVLGPTRTLPAELVSSWTNSPAWSRFLQRMATGGPLHAPGLAEALARELEDDPSPDACRLLASVGDWSTRANAERMASALGPALSGRYGERPLHALIEAIAKQDPAVRLEILSRVGKARDRLVVAALVDVVLARPTLAERLERGMLAAVDREMEAESTGGNAERVRKVLSYRAARVATATEREELIALLEQSMQHSSPRVRRHAHRLLRVHAERPRYLRATRLQLRDPDPDTVRGAIRVLSYGRDVEAVTQIAELVSHRDAGIRETAREGLILFGQEALSPLVRAIAHARPDHREALTRIREELERTS